jgi:23S rRNA (guanosine2251-2'-O)-methyltransferase
MTRRGKAGAGAPPGYLGGDQVEGCHAVHELLAAGRREVREVWVAEAASPIAELARARGARVALKGPAAFAAAARTSAHQGVIAWASPVRAMALERLLEMAYPFLVVLDGVTDPGNFGALLRSAACAGATGVVVGRHRSAPLTPAAVKAAAGAVEHLAISQVAGIPGALRQVREAGIWAVGLDPSAPEALWGSPVLGGPVALVLGAEGAGLSRLASERCDVLLRVPMPGPLASLNVAAAGAVACFEVARRREAARL